MSGNVALKNWEQWDGKQVNLKREIFEEVFHFVHKFGWATIYPDEFGLTDYSSSVICREVTKLQCV